MCKFDCSNCNGVNGDNVGIIDTLEIDLLKQGNNIKRLNTRNKIKITFHFISFDERR